MNSLFRNIRNRRAAAFVLLLITTSLPALVGFGQPQDTRLPQPAGHIGDFAEVLDAPTRKRLETILENLKEKTGINFVIATVKTAGTEDLYDYSLRVARNWNVGAPTSSGKSLLLLITTDRPRFFAQFSKGARADLPDGLFGEMGQRMRPKFEGADYNDGLITGVRIFVNALGERNNFNFEALDEKPADDTLARTRPRVVESPAPAEILPPQPSPTAVAQPSETPQAAVTPTPAEVPAAEAKPSATPISEPTALPTAEPSPLASPSAQPSETPAVAVSSPEASPSSEAPAQQPSPAPTTTIAENTARPTRSPAATRRGVPAATPIPASPEDEKEEVEESLAEPAEKRITTLKAFIAAHPQSVAVPRAYELIVVSHAMVGDQKMKGGDTEAGLQQFQLALSEAPNDIPDQLFIGVLARIPMNLFLRGQRGAALEMAHQTEALAKSNVKRLLALAEFYLTIEDADEANRIAELAVQTANDSAAAHQALGAARHIALRLDDAESEYARALTLEPKSSAARIALADLKRAAGKSDEALTLYREQLWTDPKSKSARAGVVLSLLEVGKKDEAEQELNSVLQDKDQARNLPLLVGAAYWFVAHNNKERGLDLAQRAVDIEPRYSWGQIALARAQLANDRPLDAERALRFARQYGKFPTLDYELAGVLVAIGLYDEALAELTRSFVIKDGQIETKLAGRNAARAANFTELLGLERRAAIFQSTAADNEANARTLKALLTFATVLDTPEGTAPNEDELLASAKSFTAGDDSMRTFRQIYVGGKLLRKRVALASVVELMDQATSGVEAALSVRWATVAVQPDELSDIRARALAQGGTPSVPDAPRTALSGLLRGRIEDLAGQALYNLDKPVEAAVRLRRAVSAAPERTPLWQTALWHLGAALEADDKLDQALLSYIKSYAAGAPDPARRSVIERLYKKVNGSLDGLSDKIGPGPDNVPAEKPAS